MKIAIHHYPGDFSDRWIEYCEKNGLSYEIVDCYAYDIIDRLKGFDLLLWSWNLSHFESLQFAKELIYSVEQTGLKVFPDFKTSFLYDNKLGQKYFLEAIHAPFVPTYVFYTYEEAKKWIEKTSFPKVFKLSRGAGSQNVKLCRNKQEALKLTKKAFYGGFAQVDRKVWFKDKLEKFISKPGKKSAKSLLKAMGRLFVPTEKEKKMPRELGYVYFQDFLPENEFDIRVIVIGDRAFGFKRLCREGDFRASGSGKIIYDRNGIDEKCISIAFKVSKKAKFQCMAYDFIYDSSGNPLIVEMSYHFSPYVYDECEGWWDEKLDWHNEPINPQRMIIESILKN